VKRRPHFEQVPIHTIQHIILQEASAPPAPPQAHGAFQSKTRVEEAPARRRGRQMKAPFDVFRMESNGGVLWLSAAKSRAEAESIAQRFASQAAGSYLIFDQLTSTKTVVDASEPARNTAW
jgi:hypothetical protein